MSEPKTLNCLFVCTMNQWRSPTAEKIFADHTWVVARSRGTSTKARRSVTLSDIKWADVLFPMETKHRARLLAEFPRELRYKDLHVLGIPDDYKFMDPELISELQLAVEPILADYAN